MLGSDSVSGLSSRESSPPRSHHGNTEQSIQSPISKQLVRGGNSPTLSTSNDLVKEISSDYDYSEMFPHFVNPSEIPTLQGTDLDTLNTCTNSGSERQKLPQLTYFGSKPQEPPQLTYFGSKPQELPQLTYFGDEPQELPQLAAFVDSIDTELLSDNNLLSIIFPTKTDKNLPLSSAVGSSQAVFSTSTQVTNSNLLVIPDNADPPPQYNGGTLDLSLFNNYEVFECDLETVPSSPTSTITEKKRASEAESHPPAKRTQQAPDFSGSHHPPETDKNSALPSAAGGSLQANSPYVSEMVQMLLEKNNLALDESLLKRFVTSPNLNLILKTAINKVKITNKSLPHAPERLKALIAIFSYNCGSALTNNIYQLKINRPIYEDNQVKFEKFLSIDFYENCKIDSEEAIPIFIDRCLQHTGYCFTPFSHKLIDVFKNSLQEFQKRILQHVTEKGVIDKVHVNRIIFPTLIFNYMIYHHYFTHYDKGETESTSDKSRELIVTELGLTEVLAIRFHLFKNKYRILLKELSPVSH